MAKHVKKGFRKYHAKKTVYGGVKYDSLKEATFAAQLDQLRKATDPHERVVKVERQVRFPLIPAPNAITYIADFRVTYADGREEVIDVKGYQTDVFRMKMRLMKHYYPHIPVRLIERNTKMPLYRHTCPNCGESKIDLFRFSDPPPECPKCHVLMKREIGRTSATIKWGKR